MKVRELIEKLQKINNQDDEVTLSIANAKEECHTKTIIAVLDGGRIEGWVASDDPDAFAPWADYD